MHIHALWVMPQCVASYSGFVIAAKDQAALISILFHAKSLEEQYEAPPPFRPKL
jgi:hypothetical protein